MGSPGRVKHEKDPEWLQLVLDGYCPECADQHNPRKRRLIRKGIKRECSQGHLTIYGNPEYLAYYRVEKKKDKVKDCPGCGVRAVHYDKKHDELICINQDCEHSGLVLSGPPHQIRSGLWVNYPLGNSFDYTDIDATYNPHDEVDYGDYISD